MKKNIFPTALLMTIVLIIVVELVIRFIPPSKLISYEGGAPAYEIARMMIEDVGVPDIMFLGSSRVRDAIIPSVLQSSINSDSDPQMTVGNYAIGGATSSEIIPMLKLLAKQNKLPKVIFWGISPLQIGKESVSYTPRSAIFWNFSDWLSVYNNSSKEAWELLPIVIRNEIGKQYVTLKYRSMLVPYLRNSYKSMKGQEIVNPFTSGVDRPQDIGGKKLKPTKELLDDLKLHLAENHFINGEYYLNVDRMAEINKVAKELSQLGIKVVFFEAPVSPFWDENISEESLSAYHKLVEEYIESDFLYINSPNKALENDDFKDTNHLNYNGAKKYTNNFYDSISPILQELSAGIPK